MADMIKFTDDSKQIINIWQQAFGDTDEEIIFFIENCKNKSCLGFFENNRLLSMMYLVDCICDGDMSKYVYAACTLENMQGNGYMSRLLDYCKENFKTFCLIPADERLVDFYFHRGLTEKTKTEKLIFDESEEIKEYLFEGCELEKPFVMKYIGG